MAFENGPYVQAACLCDMVLEDKTGTMSLIRIIDVLTNAVSGPNPPVDMPPMTHTFWLAVMLKSGSAVGRHEVKVVPQLPSGETKDPLVLTVHFEGGEKGANVMAQMTFQFVYEGLHWFNVYLDEAKLTAIPLLVRYNRVIAS